MSSPHGDLVFLNDDPYTKKTSPQDIDNLEARLIALEARETEDKRTVYASWGITVAGMLFAVISFAVLPAMFGVLALTCGMANLALRHRAAGGANLLAGTVALAATLFFIPAIHEMDKQKTQATENFVNEVNETIAEIEAGVAIEMTARAGMYAPAPVESVPYIDDDKGRMLVVSD